MINIGKAANAEMFVGNVKKKEESNCQKNVMTNSIFSSAENINSDFGNYYFQNTQNKTANDKETPTKTESADVKTEKKEQNTENTKPLTFTQKAWNWCKKAGSYIKDKAVEFWTNNKGTIKSAITNRLLSSIITFIATV